MSVFQIALSQFRPVKGQPTATLDRIEGLFTTCAADLVPPDLLLLPEASLSGYLLEGGVLERSWTATALAETLAARHARVGGPPLDLAIGFYELHEGRCWNAAMWLALGGDDPGIRHIHRKVFLPTYGLFDEGRFLDAGRSVQAFDTRLGRVAMLICEDVWHGLPPTIAALDGAELIVVLAAGPGRGIAPSALPGRPTTQERWEHLACAVAVEHGVHVAVAQLTGFEGGKGFPGGALLVGPDGAILARGEPFVEGLTRGVIDTAEVARVRAATPLLGDLQAQLPWLLDSLQGTRGVTGDAGGTAATLPAIPRDDPPPARALPSLVIDPALTRQWLVAFLRAEFANRGFARAVLGLSGGLDSAVVAALAVEAFGAESVTAVRLPHRQSSPESLAHARLVTEWLGVPERTLDISAAVDGYLSALGESVDAARLGNVMARVRMTALFDLSAGLNALPLGTGNKSERLLGYFTWHGDDAPPINPLGDLYKTQVVALARHLGVPDAIIDKPPSADLIVGQTDEGDFGISYRRADPVLELLLRGHRDAAVLAHGVTPEELTLVRRRLDRTHWKRQLPTVAVLSDTAIGAFYLRPVDY